MPFVVDNGASVGILAKEALENIGMHLEHESFIVLDSMFLGSFLLENIWTVALSQNRRYFKRRYPAGIILDGISTVRHSINC
jgi:hypothetical protein